MCRLSGGENGVIGLAEALNRLLERNLATMKLFTYQTYLGLLFRVVIFGELLLSGALHGRVLEQNA